MSPIPRRACGTVRRSPFRRADGSNPGLPRSSDLGSPRRRGNRRRILRTGLSIAPVVARRVSTAPDERAAPHPKEHIMSQYLVLIYGDEATYAAYSAAESDDMLAAHRT